MPADPSKTTKRRLAAVLSGDAVGYSRLMSEDEEATIAALGKARETFRSLIASHEGRVVDTAGDSVLAVFDSVVEALRSAVEIQEELRRRSEDVPDARRMSFRIGVNVGDLVEQSDGTVYGDGVNIAARLQALAEPGGICVSELAFAQARNKLEARFEFLGEQQVKNIPEPVRAYRLLPRDRGASAEPKSLSSKPSIAVLPFENMSADPEQEYFSDGISEDLITALSRIRWLFVVARNSTFTYKGKAVDVKQVARELAVHFVLEGSVRKGGGRVRITAQLIDASTGSHVWAERYDRELADIFAVQDEITETIAAAIEPELAQFERERARRKPPESLDAWDLYQRGLWHIWQFGPRDNEEARGLLERATSLDTTFAPFFSALALCYFQDHVFMFHPTENVLDKAFDAARRAVALDDKDATGHAVLGRVYTARGEHAPSIVELETALRLNPSLSWAHYGLGMALVLTGRAEEGIREVDLAERLSPHDPNLWVFEMVRAWGWMSIGDFNRAREQAERSVHRPLAAFPAWGTLASALGHLGRIDEARSALAKTLELQPTFSPQLFDRVWPNMHSAFFECFVDGIRLVDPTFSDPRLATSRPTSRSIAPDRRRH
ncbi:MAG TPA: adenylate/guanylate cyclase domain-containing protein [Candidatus Binatia bacterium]|nr:adenylate/guanylate cyclase domain-containing protein [Candidatus Binatia bacterium]